MVMPKKIQVGIVKDHFWCESDNKPGLSAPVMSRIRHCVECQKCFTRYVVSRSPYDNGSYLLSTIEGGLDEYILYCRCKATPSRWKAAEFKSCDVSAAAFERGYGTAEEIRFMRGSQQEWSVDRSRYLKDWKTLENRSE